MTEVRTRPKDSVGPTPPSPGRRIGRWVWAVARIYLVIVLIMMLLENYLIFPAPKYPAGDWAPSQIRVEEVYFNSADGTRLHGWYVDHPQPLAYVMYCHGNAEHLGFLDWLLEELHELDVAVFAFDYRGYGRSEGSPNEQGVLADGHAAHEWLARRAGIPKNQVVLMGRSIGGAVAIDAAVPDGARGLVLDSTFTSLPDVAASFYWWLPVRWCLRSRFDSEAKIAGYHGPLLQSHATADRIIPFELGQRLYAACPSTNKRFFTIEGGDHNEGAPPVYYHALREFLESLPKEASGAKK